MNAYVFSEKTLIGTSTLQSGDVSMGHVFGTLNPTKDYKEIQNHVHNYWGNPQQNLSIWSELRLNVRLGNGVYLHPAGGITINDSKEYPDDAILLDIAGVDTEIINDFIANKEQRPFVEEPWEEISIDFKLNAENELRKELGIFEDKEKRPSSPNNTTGNYSHILLSCSFSAFCKDCRNDGVLFSIVSPDLKSKFALVHLTYKGSQELNGWPYTKLFDDFDSFKYYQMYPDKADWEE